MFKAVVEEGPRLNTNFYILFAIFARELNEEVSIISLLLAWVSKEPGMNKSLIHIQHKELDFRWWSERNHLVRELLQRWTLKVRAYLH